MKDKNGIEIKAGHLVKRGGFVRYADGMKHKYSKNTWRISRVDEDGLYYEVAFKDGFGNEMIAEEKLSLPKVKGEFLVVGDKKGIYKEYMPPKEVKITVGTNFGVYKVLKDVTSQNWEKGDIVKISGDVDYENLSQGILERVSDDTPHRHLMVVVDPVRLQGKALNVTK